MLSLDIEKIKAGNEEALRDLFKKPYPFIYNTAKKKLPKYDVTTIEDIVQEVFIKIFKNLDKTKSNDAKVFLSWCYAVATRVISNLSRQLLFKEDTANFFDHETSNLGLQTQFHRSLIDLDDFLEKVIQKPGDEEKELFQEYYIEGKTLKQIAKEKGCSLSTLTRSLHKIHAKLRKSIKGEECHYEK